MNERIQKLALQAGLINYIDNETPRRYLVSGNADLEEVKEFAQLIVRECAELADESTSRPYESYGIMIKQHFGVE